MKKIVTCPCIWGKDLVYAMCQGGCNMCFRLAIVFNSFRKVSGSIPFFATAQGGIKPSTFFQSVHTKVCRGHM